MTMQIDNFFYSPNNANAFWVFGYWEYQSTLPVLKQCEALTDAAKKFSEMSGCKLEDVHSYVIEKSQRYSRMRVFYCQTMIAPKGAYNIAGNSWDMKSWLHN